MKNRLSLMSLSVSVLLAAAAVAAPKIEFDQTTYDFGSTSGVTAVSGKFILQNTGDAELKVSKPAPACGCTVAGVNPDTLKPGEKAELAFTLNTGHSQGLLQKTITVPSNDPQNPTVKLTLKVNLVQLFTATPTQFMLGDIRQGTTTNLTVQLKRLDGKKLELTKVQASGDTVAPQPPVLGTDESTATVELVVKAGADARRFNENVQFFASGGAAPAGFVQVFGRVVGDVTVNPERLIWAFGNLERLPASRLEGALTRQFIVTCNRADQKVELKNLTTTVKGLELKPTTLTEGQSYQVMAKFAQAPTDSVSGVVTFETGLASQPTITIPVSVNVVKQP